ncbi:hypothetical protein CesoFtcFv8_024634 [Champsocephalus esox]|uniref:Uncharacterized protein n=1 Tax=Champsocephalus esox TaxID=159716 RepID=A0AAN8B6T7_9TELE|nr:hypothetical protein CesoFtcFv8_024634 [Champsocephalus esox]
MEESPAPFTPPINTEDTLPSPHSSLYSPFPLSPSPTLLEIAEHTKEIQRVGTDSFLEFKDQTKAIRRIGSMSFTPAPQRRPPKSPCLRQPPPPLAACPLPPHRLPRLHHRADVNHLPSLQESICSLRSLIRMCVYKTQQTLTDMCWVQAHGRMALSTLSRTYRGPACQ